jgi:hypothetical protein
MDLVVSIASLAPNARMTKCRGPDCQTAPLSVRGEYTGHSYVTGVACGACGVSSCGFYCGGEVDASTGNVTLTVAGFDAADGDVLSVTITNPDGAIVAEHTGVMAREDYYPNGPDCSPTCTHGRF